MSQERIHCGGKQGASRRIIRWDSEARMDELVFEGEVSRGKGCHSTLRVPGRETISNCPHDWPLTLSPGSLNIRVDVYPPQLDARGLTSSVVELDRALFVPEFEILRDQFGNNKLGPRPGMPRCGDAQVWRAKIVREVGEVGECWVLRRFGSHVGEQLELVADRRLRDNGLHDGQRVTVTLYGHWKDA